MTTIGYHASHEQFPPSQLLDCVQQAEAAGFDAAMCSDHFHPWSTDQGESGFSFAWLGAALQATGLPMGVVCAPGYRYHPAIVAQATATLAEMFPQRFWPAFGSGQALNEAITGQQWPSKPERNARLEESVQIIRQLWSGETVDHRGLIHVEQATLYTRPDNPPPAFGAAITPGTARRVANWADGMITIAHPIDELEEVVDAFRNSGGADKPMYLQMQLSFADDDETALQQAYDQWRTNIFDSPLLSELRTPEQFEAAASFVEPDDLQGPVRCSSNLHRHTQWIREVLQLGFDAVFLHNVGPNQREFISAFGEQVLPKLGN